MLATGQVIRTLSTRATDNVLLLHVRVGVGMLQHFDRNHPNLSLVRVNFRYEDDMITLVALDRVRVGNNPNRSVRVAHKRLTVSADFARNGKRFGRIVALFRLILILRQARR